MEWNLIGDEEHFRVNCHHRYDSSFIFYIAAGKVGIRANIRFYGGHIWLFWTKKRDH